MLSGATCSAAETAGTAVFRIVVSSDSMNSATATSHGSIRLLASDRFAASGSTPAAPCDPLDDAPGNASASAREDSRIGAGLLSHPPALRKSGSSIIRVHRIALYLRSSDRPSSHRIVLDLQRSDRRSFEEYGPQWLPKNSPMRCFVNRSPRTMCRFSSDARARQKISFASCVQCATHFSLQQSRCDTLSGASSAHLA